MSYQSQLPRWSINDLHKALISHDRYNTDEWIGTGYLMIRKSYLSQKSIDLIVGKLSKSKAILKTKMPAFDFPNRRFENSIDRTDFEHAQIIDKKIKVYTENGVGLFLETALAIDWLLCLYRVKNWSAVICLTDNINSVWKITDWETDYVYFKILD